MKWGLGLVLIASVAAIVAGVKFDTMALHAFGLMFAALMIIEASLATNIPYWVGARDRVELASAAARTNAEYMALTYLWGAATMLAVYRLSGLDWRHDWQYAAGLAVIAAGLFVYATRIGVPGSSLGKRPALRGALVLTVLQGLGVVGGLAYMLASGKLLTPKGDWVANHVFLVGGLSLAMLSLIATVTQLRLARGRMPARQA